MNKPRAWGWVLLFTTSGTLLCCAIPIALVAMGLGATLATLASSAPWLIVLSQHKAAMFIVSGLLIALAGWAVYRPGRSCPTDPQLAAACARADSWNRKFIVISAAMWALGFVAAYGLPVLLRL